MQLIDYVLLFAIGRLECKCNSLVSVDIISRIAVAS